MEFEQTFPDGSTTRWTTTARFEERVRFDPATGEPAPEIYETLRARADTRYRVAFAEGVTSWQVVEGLRAVEVLSGDVTEIPPEGSLAPDSYELRAGDTRQSVLDRMTRTALCSKSNI